MNINASDATGEFFKFGSPRIIIRMRAFDNTKQVDY